MAESGIFRRYSLAQSRSPVRGLLPNRGREPGGNMDIRQITSEQGYDRTQAYMIASIMLDMRIGQPVDVPSIV